MTPRFQGDGIKTNDTKKPTDLFPTTYENSIYSRYRLESRRDVKSSVEEGARPVLENTLSMLCSRDDRYSSVLSVALFLVFRSKLQVKRVNVCILYYGILSLRLARA
jgi:hypothetical protein